MSLSQPNRDRFIPPKLVYFFFFAAGAVLSPVLTLYYRESGLSGAQVGVLAALLPALRTLGAPVWGGVSDVTGRHRLILVLGMCCAVVSSLAFTVASRFFLLLPIVVLYAFGSAPVMPMIDHAVLERMGDRRNRYGTVRLWGAVGWGLAAPLAGRCIDLWGIRVAFPLYAVLMTGCMGVSFFLPMGGAHPSPRVRGGFRSFLRDPRWIFFLLIVFVRGIGGSFTEQYLFIFIRGIGGGPMLMGIALTVATVSELVAYVTAHKLLARFGAGRLLITALAATSVRLFLHYLIRTPELVLLSQLMHGVTFSLFWVAGVTLARELAPSGYEATAQSVFTATNMGAGGVVGALIGGILLDLLGVNGMFLAAALVTAVGVPIFVVAERRFSEAGGG